MNQIVQVILETIWLFLPAGVGNMVPVIAAKCNWLPNWGKPIHARLLGVNKTWRGLILGSLFGSVTAIIQFLSFSFPPFTSLHSAFMLGLLLGFGALVGDAAKSFFKRRLHVNPGESWPIVDQVDSIMGALVFIAPFVVLTFANVIAAIIIFGPISFVVSNIGVRLKIKKSL